MNKKKKSTDHDEVDTRKGELKMATQLQPTPTLYGKDAEAVFEELKKKPMPEQIKKSLERAEHFKNIKKKGLD